MIGFTKQAFTEYVTPILERAFDIENDNSNLVMTVEEAREIIKSILFEAYELDPKITNLTAQLYDIVTVLKNLLERGQVNAWVHKALQQDEVMTPILGILNALNTQVVGDFRCEQAEANPDHKCINQCWVCRFPAQREKQQPNGDKK